MVAPILPRPQASMLGQSGRPTTEWFDFFRLLLQFVAESGADSGVIASILARLDELEQDGSNFAIQGLLSVQVSGTPAGGVVQLMLDGDSSAPGARYFYGTDADGTKSFHSLQTVVMPMTAARMLQRC